MCLLIPHIPPEVLSEVIEIACLSGTSLVKLTHVSAYWREVAIRNKKLWTVVLIRNERDMDRAEEYARRSSGVPMMVALALQHSQHIPPVFDRISRYISTSKTFPPIVGSLRVDLSRLEVPNVFTLPSSYNIDLTLFPASLHTVDISLPSVADLDHPFNMPALLRGLATLDKLHSFTLSGDYYWHVDHVPTIPYHLSNLKKIKLSHRHVPALLFLSTPSLSSVHVQVDATDQRPNRVLSRLVTLAGHSLQDLQLHVLNYAADDEDDLLASLPVTNALSPVVWSFPDLHSLSLTIHYSDILACIRADRLTFFMLNMDMFTTAQLGEMTRFLHIHSSTLERVHITITSYYYVRAASAAAGSPPHYPQHTVWPNLHSITIRTTSIVAISPFIPATMPNLKTLSLTIDEFVPADDWELLINFITQISQSLVDLSLHLNTHQPISPGDILGPRPDSDPIVFPALCSFTSTSALADIFVLYLRRAKYVTKIHLVGDDYQWALATSDEDVRSGITPVCFSSPFISFPLFSLLMPINSYLLHSVRNILSFSHLILASFLVW